MLGVRGLWWPTVGDRRGKRKERDLSENVKRVFLTWEESHDSCAFSNLKKIHINGGFGHVKWMGFGIILQKWKGPKKKNLSSKISHISRCCMLGRKWENHKVHFSIYFGSFTWNFSVTSPSRSKEILPICHKVIIIPLTKLFHNIVS